MYEKIPVEELLFQRRLSYFNKNLVSMTIIELWNDNKFQ